MDEFNKSIEWAISEIQGSSALSLERNRPYDGQPQTSRGGRGKQEVKGLTIRDVCDCMVLGFLDCAGIHRECPIHDDIYTIDLSEIDPGAMIRNAACHIEKMMGIYPNVPGLKD